MLQRRPGKQARKRAPIRARRLLWVIVLLDVMVAAWMTVAGEWLDRSPLTSVATLGGHHVVVLALALTGFAVLAVLAPLTAGFTTANGSQRAGIAVAGVASAVALAGVLSVAALVVVLALLVVIIGWVLSRSG
ncbi:hypothetical protein [Pseudonocardia acaciae]|uniref:hypothetical protein n=1 Tax=Pseudonocardia acaciae TaxID=551276 RepID=UPI0012ED0F94|nr:hypothetical protein [Pseudonocardia acaciae]